MHLKSTLGTTHKEAKSSLVLTSLQHGPTAFDSVDTITVSMPKEGLWNVPVTASSYLDGLVVHTKVLAAYQTQVHLTSHSVSPFANDVKPSLRGLMGH